MSASDELRRQLRLLTGIRAVAVPFAVVQILTFYRPYPPGVEQMALGWAGFLAIGAVVVHLGATRAAAASTVRRWAVAGLLLDTVVALGLVTVHTFDPETAVWALLYLLPLEGAMLFQLRGALSAIGLATVGYTLREVYGAIVHDVPFLAVSVSFRMGIGVILAVGMGMTARRLVGERDRLSALTHVLEQRTDDLAAANRALRSARRSQSEFVALTNHELRTPLTSILGFSRTLGERWEDMDDGMRRAAVQAIDQQSRRLDELVQDMLTVSSMHSGEVLVSPRSVQLAPCLHDALAVAEVTATVRCADDVVVSADPTRLLQVLVNLLRNAKRYGGAPIIVSGSRRGDRVVIEVLDHGPGVPEDFVPHMFEEFAQASVGPSRTAGGQGLGLAIVKYLVTALEGTVTYRPVSPTGASFSIDLPCGDRQAVVDRRPPAAERPSRQRPPAARRPGH